jgi:hypothetical protein
MATSNSFQYPNVNVPPIVYQNEQKGDSTQDVLATPPTDMTATIQLGQSLPTVPSTTRQTPVSFVPSNTNGGLVPMEGDVKNAQQHLLTSTEFISPTKTQVVSNSAISATGETSRQENFHELEDAKRGYTKITRADEEAMKFYVAGMGVISLLILYRIMY